MTPGVKLQVVYAKLRKIIFFPVVNQRLGVNPRLRVASMPVNSAFLPFFECFLYFLHLFVLFPPFGKRY